MADEFSANRVFLLQAPWSVGQTTLTDLSANPSVIANTNVVCSSNATLFGQNTLSFADAGNNYLNVPSSAKFNLYPTATVELWFKVAAFTSNIYLLYCGTYGYNEPWSILWIASQSKFMCTQSYGTVFHSDAITAPNSDWHHIALVGDGSQYWFWLDGVQIGYRNGGVSFPNQVSQLWIGGVSWVTIGKLQGSIGNTRITKGIALYTQPFTPPTELFPVPDPITGLIMPSALRRDLEFGGRYQIVGTAQRLGASSRKRIRLHDRRSGILIREVWSATDGSFAFTDLKNAPEAYIVMELDDLANNPWLDQACADRVTPEIMP